MALDLSTIGNFISSNSGAIGFALGTGAQLYGQQNAGEAITKAANAGIGVANTAMGDVGGYWSGQQKLGAGANTALGSALGINGKPADYTNFMNMPGYQFAVNQGTQAIQRQAAAGGNAFTPNTLASVGQYVTGTAMQDYNTYINQLYQAAGLGSTANSAMTDARLRTAGNIEQLGMNSGMAQAGYNTGMGQTIGNFLGGPGSPNGSGVGGGQSGTSGVVNLAGKGISYLGKLFGGNPASYTVPGDIASAASTDYGAISGLDSGASDLFGSGGSGFGSSGINSLGSAFDSSLGNLGDLSFSAAGGEAATGAAASGLAPVGVDSIDVLPSVSSAVDAGASQGGAALGAGAGGAAAVGLAALPFILSQVVPEGETSSWWKGAQQNLQSPHGADATTQQIGNYWGAVTELLGMVSNDPKNSAQAASLLNKAGLGSWVQEALGPSKPGSAQSGGRSRQTTRF
jgi:hypothetical protein